MSHKYRCPYCGFTETDKRKVITHIYMSSDEKHGNYRKSPDGFSPDLIEVIKTVNEGGDMMQTPENEEKGVVVSEHEKTEEVSQATPEPDLDELQQRAKNLPSVLDKINELAQELDQLKTRLSVLEDRIEKLRSAVLDILNALGA